MTALPSFTPDARPPPPVQDLDVDFDLIDTRAGFDALKPEWDALFEEAGRPAQLFQRHGLLAAWADTYLGRVDRMAVLVGRVGGIAATIWPMVRRRRFGMVDLSIMGEPVVQFADVLCTPENRAAVMASAWAWLRAMDADVFHARKVRADAALSNGLPDRTALLYHHEAAPFADLASRVGAHGPGEAYSGKERSDFRRRMRRLAERGAVRFETHHPGSTAEALATQAIAWKRAWLENQGRASTTLGCPRFDAFFKACSRHPDSGLRVASLSRAGVPIGVDLSFDCKGSGFGHVIAVDPACEREGVGNVLIHQVFAAAKARGDTRFEMLAPADGYKMRHADGSVAVSDIAVPFTASGRLYADLVLKRAVPLAKTAMRRLPRSLAQPMARLFG